MSAPGTTMNEEQRKRHSEIMKRSWRNRKAGEIFVETQLAAFYALPQSERVRRFARIVRIVMKGQA